MELLTRISFLACLFYSFKEIDALVEPGFAIGDFLRLFERNEDVGLTREGPESAASRYVIGGTAVLPGRFPFMANLFQNKGFPVSPYCGGVLIAENVVLTAAHCVAFSTPDLIQVGKTDLSDNSDNAEIFRTQSIHVHPQYDPNKNLYDIALIELVQSSSFPSIEFPSAKAHSRAMDKGKPTVVGWGKTTRGKWRFPNPILTEATLKIVEPKECKSRWKTYVSEKIRERLEDLEASDPSIDIEAEMKKFEEQFEEHWGETMATTICAFGDGERTGCYGDSGGPLLMKSESPDTSDVLLGVVSFGPVGCLHKAVPGVYTNLEFSREWVLDVLAALSQPNMDKKEVLISHFSSHLGSSVKASSSLRRTFQSFSLMALLGIPVVIGVMASQRRHQAQEGEHEVRNQTEGIVEAAAEEIIEAAEQLEREQARNISRRIPRIVENETDVQGVATIEQPSLMSHNDL